MKNVSSALAFVVILLLTPTSFATPLSSFVRVMSYDEVMQLSPAKRTAYLRGLRAMMIEIERLPKNRRSVSNEPSRTAEIASLLSMFSVDEAQAETGVPYPGPNGAVTCGPGFNARVPVQHTLGVNGTPTDPAMFVCIVGKKTSKGCARGSMPVRQDPDGSFECATMQSFNRLSQNLKYNARVVRHTDSVFDHSTKHFTEGYPPAESFAKAPVVSLPAPAKPQSESDVAVHLTSDAVVMNTTPQKRPTVAKPQTSAVTPPKASEAPKNETGKAIPVKTLAPKIVKAKAATPKAEATTEPISADKRVVVSPSLAKAVAQHQIRPDNDTTDDDTDTTSDDPKPAADLTSCEPTSTAKTCDSSAVEKARRQYATDADPDCIYAGSISTYQDGKKHAYGCVAPSRFCFNATNCTDETGDHTSADYSCEKNQVICNPLVFGVHADGKAAFCVDKSANATAACDDEAKSDDKAVSPLDEKHAGLKEAWNDFADRLFTLCNKNKIAAQLHCAECDIISKRLFALNVASRDVKSCGAAIKYEEANCDDDGVCHGRPGATQTKLVSRKRGISSVDEESPAPADGNSAQKH